MSAYELKSLLPCSFLIKLYNFTVKTTKNLLNCDRIVINYNYPYKTAGSKINKNTPNTAVLSR